LLQDILARADVAAALREPVLEGQSASVFTQMLAGVPVLVYNHAHYAELPDAAAIKVVPGTEAALRDALRALVKDPEKRKRHGEAGRDYILSTRSGERYAEAIREAGDRALAARPMVHLNTDLANRIRLRTLGSSDDAVEIIADLAFELFDLQ
jgi:glycosyltransferase involved in cell wall biosynthesis